MFSVSVTLQLAAHTTDTQDEKVKLTQDRMLKIEQSRIPFEHIFERFARGQLYYQYTHVRRRAISTIEGQRLQFSLPVAEHAHCSLFTTANTHTTTCSYRSLLWSCSDGSNISSPPSDNSSDCTLLIIYLIFIYLCIYI